MPKICPQCGRCGLDYNHTYKQWQCVWSDCNYKEDKLDTNLRMLKEISSSIKESERRDKLANKIGQLLDNII